MSYVSTRGHAGELPFDQVLLTGLATDGGLYLPAVWPSLSAADFKAMAGRPHAEVAARVMTPFLFGSIDAGVFAEMVTAAYSGFDHAAVAPLAQLGDSDWMLELFHGPTLSFKDYALQLVGRLFDHVLRRAGRRVTIVVATSGDTGSAAIEACRGRDAIDIVVLHPKGRVSEVQRRQMTTAAEPNVHNLAIEGTFDDCQNLVKALFHTPGLREEVGLAAMNSINWARIMAQVVYYVTAAVALGAPDRPVAFAVPTGNFGNIFAGYVARRIGLPVAQLVIGSNANDILTRFLATGDMRMEGVVPTLSPSMDIEVSSNFERLLYDLLDGNPAAVAARMDSFRQSGSFTLGDVPMQRARRLFAACRLDDAETLSAIGALYRGTGLLIDPHSAIGIAAGRARRRDPAIPLVALATAHAAKFPDAVERATGRRPELPPRLADLMERPERMQSMAADAAELTAFVRRVAWVAK